LPRSGNALTQSAQCVEQGSLVTDIGPDHTQPLAWH